MNKNELTKRLAEELGCTRKQADKMIYTLTDIITQAMLDGERVHLFRFGHFEAKQREPRVGRNLTTHEEIIIESRRSPSFQPSKLLKNVIKG